MKHRDPSFLKRHLQSPEGAGRNILSVLCCNYYLIKIIAEPFLNTSRGVQDMVENTAECVQVTRTRLSCTDFLSSANLTALPEDSDLENGALATLKKYDENRKSRKPSALSNCYNSCCSVLTNATTGRVIHWFGFIVSIGIVFIFVYASFTV